MPPKKKKGGKKKPGVKKVTVIPVDDKLPPLSHIKSSVMVDTIRSNDVPSLKRLVVHYNYGDALAMTDVNGSTPLHIAVKKNDSNLVQLLISYERIDLNALEIHSIGGNSALHHACILDNSRVVELLLKAGALPNVKSNSINGETPLHLCCKLGHVNCAKSLIQSGALVDMKDNFGNNASFWASEYRQSELMNELSLPPVKRPTVKDLMNIMVQNNPNFRLPTVKVKGKKKKDKDGKKKNR
jgi:ankyrin repeat protein